MSGRDMIVLGRIVGSYGLRGWVKFHPFGDDVADLGIMKQWWLGVAPDGMEWTPYVLQELKQHAKGWIAKFAEVSDRNGSEAIDGLYVAATHDALPKTAADEYYWADLIGLTVVNMKGECLGKVSELLSSGAHDVLCVVENSLGATATAKQRLLPFVAQVVKRVDSSNATIYVDWGVDW